MKHILFICTRNLNRSPTFESRIRKKLDANRFEVRSAGIFTGYPYQINSDILDWADIVFVMDLSHELFIREHFPEHIKKVKVVGVSDQYNTGDESLLEVIDYWFKTRWKEYKL